MINKNKIKGFTLVELLVVIAIIGILSSVAVISLGSAKDKARIAKIVGEMSQLQPVILLCLNSGELLTFDQAGHNEKYVIYSEGGGIEDSVREMAICANMSAEIYWPIYWDIGYYYDSVESNVSLQTWQLVLCRDECASGVQCSDTDGCQEF